MCGISGFLCVDRSVGRDELERMTRAIAHRGPDASGVYFDEENGAALGHRRLSILDLSERANQPFYSEDKRFVIVFNGEVYNYREIAAELEIPMRTGSDTELVLEVFIKEGASCVQRFNGMFAFAIWDSLEKRMFIARDRLGIKPVYYHFGKSGFFFASELKSLLTLPYIYSFNQTALSGFLNLGYIPHPHSAFNEIQKFPAGSFAWVSDNTIEIHAWWNPEVKFKNKTLSDENEALHELKNLVETSVKYRLISDVPFGTFLSGGIDSSLVSAVAATVHNTRLDTYTIGFEENAKNEALFAREVAKHIGSRHHEFILKEKDAVPLLEEILDTYDEPFADSSAIPTMMVSKIAASEVKMILSGDGGDELFMGYGAYNWAQRLNKPLFKSFHNQAAALLNLGNNRAKRAAGVLKYSESEHLYQHIFSQEQYLFSLDELKDISLSGYASFYPDLFFTNIQRTLSPAEQQAYFDLRYYLKDDLLVKVDRASMKYGLEVRVPLLDYRIVEFALNLNESLKMKNGEQKYLLKKLLYSYLPESLFKRPKQGFSIPLNKWLKNEMYYLVNDYLSKQVIERHGRVKYPKVEELIRRWKNGEEYLYNRIWVLITLHKFLEKHS